MTGLIRPGGNRESFLTELELEQIRRGLRPILPTLSDSDTLKLLSEGFSSYVILVADHVILRIAKIRKAGEGYLKERAILPHLRRHFPFQVPEPEWYAEPSEVFPFGAIGYRAIPGIPFSLRLAPSVNLKNVAEDLARFLVSLHNFPLDTTRSFGITEKDDLESLRSEVMPALSAHLSKDDYKKLTLWWEEFRNNPVLHSFTPKLIHGDPWGENIILNEKLDHVVGIIDFECVTMGDVAQDFAAQKYLGQGFLSPVVEYYRDLGGDFESNFLSRLQRHSMLRELGGLLYAIRYPESDEFQDSLQKVRSELRLSL